MVQESVLKSREIPTLVGTEGKKIQYKMMPKALSNPVGLILRWIFSVPINVAILKYTLLAVRQKK